MILCSNVLGRYKGFPVFREEGAVSLYVLEVGRWQRGEPGSCWIFWGTLRKRGSQFFKENGCDPRRSYVWYATKYLVSSGGFELRVDYLQFTFLTQQINCLQELPSSNIPVVTEFVFHSTSQERHHWKLHSCSGTWMRCNKCFDCHVIRNLWLCQSFWGFLGF